MNTDTEYDTIAKARAYLGMIISAPKGRFVEMDVTCCIEPIMSFSEPLGR